MRSTRWPVDEIVRAQADLAHAVEHVELGDAQAADAIELEAAAQQRDVEPAAAARPSGDRAEFGAAFGEAGADVVGELGREGPGADARRIALTMPST
jgi:hypothetical protein